MKNLRDYEELIRNLVSKENINDKNWDWSVRSFGKYCVRIRWGYLDYIGCKECFTLSLKDMDPEDNEWFLVSRTPDDEMIDGYFITDGDSKRSWQSSYENGIESALKSLFSYAHSRY